MSYTTAQIAELFPDLMRIGDATLRVCHTRGHANHHFVVHDPARDTVYTGDTFGLVYPRLQRAGRFAYPSTSPTDFDAEAALASVDRVLALGTRSACLTHFGEVADLPAERPAGAVPLAFEGQELLLVNLVDAVDVGAERARLEKLVAEKSKVIAGYESKLGNPGYVAKAPPKVVEETRAMLAEAKADVDAARRALDALR